MIRLHERYDRIKKIYDFLDSLGKTSYKKRESKKRKQRLNINAFAKKEEREYIFETYDKFDKWFNSLEKLVEDNEGNIRPLIGISGSWRTINEEVIGDVSNVVRYALNLGMGIITGGALGVDYIATKTVLDEKGDLSKQLRLVLPINRYSFIERYFDVSNNRYGIDISQATNQHSLMNKINEKYPYIIFDDTHFEEDKFLNPRNKNYRTDAYYDRNGLIVYGCDALIGFWVNETEGVEDTINKCDSVGKPNRKNEYLIDENSQEVVNDYNKLIIPNLSYKPSDSDILDLSNL